MSFQKYKVIDILMFTTIGIITEALAMYLEVAFIPCIPIFVVALLFIEVTLIRWGSIGMLTVPIFAVVNFIVGYFFLPDTVSANYSWKTIVENLVSFSACGLSLLFFRKNNVAKMMKNMSFILVFSLSIHLSVVLIDGIMVTLLQGGNLFSNILNSIIYTIVGMVLTPLLLFILNGQGVTKNVKQSFLEKKEELEAEREFQESLNFDDDYEETDDIEEKDGV